MAMAARPAFKVMGLSAVPVAMRIGVTVTTSMGISSPGSCTREGRTAQTGPLRALLLAGDDTDRQAARKALTKTALTALAA